MEKKEKNNSFWKVLITIGIAVIGVVYSYGVLSKGVSVNAEGINANTRSIMQNIETNRLQDIATVKISSDVGYMKEDIAEIKKYMTDQMKILEEIRQEVIQ
jgi:hypothetical protein